VFRPKPHLRRQTQVSKESKSAFRERLKGGICLSHPSQRTRRMGHPSIGEAEEPKRGFLSPARKTAEHLVQQQGCKGILAVVLKAEG
jgi:hypothetical protein